MKPRQLPVGRVAGEEPAAGGPGADRGAGKAGGLNEGAVGAGERPRAGRGVVS